MSKTAAFLAALLAAATQPCRAQAPAALTGALDTAQTIVGRWQAQRHLDQELMNSVYSPSRVRALLKAGADPNARALDGDPVLALAVESGKEGSVAALLKAGARVEAPSAHGDTALILAAENDDSQGSAVAIVADLLTAKANVDARDDSRQTPLMLAATNARDVIAAALIRAHADVGATDKEGRTALTDARWRGDGYLISMLRAAEAAK